MAKCKAVMGSALKGLMAKMCRLTRSTWITHSRHWRLHAARSDCIGSSAIISWLNLISLLHDLHEVTSTLLV